MKMSDPGTWSNKYTIFFALMMLYVIVRAINIPIIYDEAITYRSFVASSVWSIVTCTNADANNHILNTLLTKFFVAILGNSVFILRLTSVLSFALYLYSASKVSRLLMGDNNVAFLTTVCLCLHPGLTDYFALCRGYGLSIALMMYAIWQSILFVRETRSSNYAHRALVATTLSVYSILSMLTFAAGIYLAVFIILFRRSGLYKAILIPLLHFILLLALISYPIYALNNNDAFYWGGDSNFVKDTLLTMLQEFTQTRRESPIQVLLLAVTIFAAILMFYQFAKQFQQYLRRSSNIEPDRFVAPFLLIFCIACINIQFYLLSVKLVIFRTALYLYPLYILSAFLSFQHLKTTNKRLLSLLVTGVIALNFATTINTRYAFEAVSNGYTLEVLSDVQSYKQSNNEQIKLFAHLYEEPGLNYYISNGLTGNKLAAVPYALLERSDMKIYDYLLLTGEDSYKAPDFYKVKKVYGHRDLVLFENTERN